MADDSDVGEIEGVATTETNIGFEWVVIDDDVKDIEASGMLVDGVS